MSGLTPTPWCLVKADFRAWLEEQPEGATVGTAREDCDCPITRYVRHRFPLPNAVTGSTVLHPNGRDGGHAWRLEEWARDFVRELDGSDDDYDRGPEPVSREAALALLDLH